MLSNFNATEQVAPSPAAAQLPSRHAMRGRAQIFKRRKMISPPRPAPPSSGPLDGGRPRHAMRGLIVVYALMQEPRVERIHNGCHSAPPSRF